MFNMPVLGLKNSKLDISADICTKLNFAYDVRFVLCSTYET